MWRGDGVQCGVRAIGFDYPRLYFSILYYTILYYTGRTTRIVGAAPHFVFGVNNKKRNRRCFYMATTSLQIAYL